MHILYLSQYFPPEAGATQTRSYEMAHNLVLMGHQVTMITEVPNHPSGIIPPEYRGEFFYRSNLDGIDVIRVWVKATPKKNFINRMLFYITFMFFSSIAGLFITKSRYDLIYASSPPLFVGHLGYFEQKRIPLVFEVRDLWPESAIALGELTNPLAIRWASRLEEACYAQAKKVIVVTRGIYKRLVQRGIPEDRLSLIPNGANTDIFQFHPEARERIRAKLGLAEKFVVIYAGIHGIAQGLETVIEAARLLANDTRVYFVLIGEGPQKREIANLVRRYELTNLNLLPEQPREAIPDYLSAADAALVPLRNLDIFEGALPSKIFDAWACNRPVLISIDGEARQVVELAGGGIYVPPEDAVSLKNAILSLLQDDAGNKTMGNNGRAFEFYAKHSCKLHRLASL
jgi:glycosyltransferase involved in cell wall biosynthesis